MNRIRERDSPESPRVSPFQSCGTRPAHSIRLTRCGSATRGPAMRFMEGMFRIGRGQATNQAFWPGK